MFTLIYSLYCDISATRAQIDIEGHWSKDVLPSIQFSGNEKEYEANFQRLLEENPCPVDYMKDEDFEKPVALARVRKL